MIGPEAEHAGERLERRGGATLIEQRASELETRLRSGRIPVIARMLDDRVAIDLRTVPESDESVLSELLIDAARA